MWKPDHRAAADRRGLRYDSDLTDAEWLLVAPLIRPAKRGGRPRTVNVREVLNAIFYVLWTGCQWKALPKDLPPRSTVWEYLDLWDWDGTLGRIHHVLYVEVREKAGREASPTTAIIDSQTATGRRRCSGRLGGAFPLSSASSATPATRGRRWKPPSPALASGSFRSAAAATGTASSSSRSAGSSSAPSLGSAAAAGSPETTSATPAKPQPSSAWP